jgi:hypothetical protein
MITLQNKVTGIPDVVWFKSSNSESKGIRKENAIEGDELTYPQACSLISYLVDKYSIDKVLAYCKNNKDFNGIFGSSYEKLKSDLIAYLTR